MPPQRPIGLVLRSCLAAVCGITREMQASVRTCVYVDDIAVHVMGDRAFVAITITAVAQSVVASLEDELAMKVSRRSHWSQQGKGKTEVAVNAPE